jgi:hypothetical protein
MEVNSQSLRCTEKRSVLNAVNLTGALAYANASQDRGLLQSHALRVFGSKSEQAQLKSMRRRYHVPASSIRVPFSHVFLRRHPFQVIGMVVRFVAIAVMNEIRVFWLLKPAERNDTVKQPQFPYLKVSILAKSGAARRQLSQNFPGPRYRVKVVEESVFHFVNNYALQGCLQLRVMVMGSIIPELQE